MKISTEIGSAAHLIGEERAIESLAKAGFDAWDFSMFAMCDYDWRLGAVRPTTHPLAGENYLAFARKLKQIGLDNGITCNQSHAPFPSHVPEIFDSMKRALECTAEAGGVKVLIPHHMDLAMSEDVYLPRIEEMERAVHARVPGCTVITPERLRWYHMGLSVWA